MGFRNIVYGTVSAMALLSLLLVWFYPSTQDFMPSNQFWNGLSDFIQLSGTKPTESLDDLGTPVNTVLITIPYAPYRDEELERIKNFVIEGSTLVILDDFGQGNSILKYLNQQVRFSGIPLVDPLFNFKSPKLPRVTSFEGRLGKKGFGAISLNRPTALIGMEAVSEMARSSESSFLDSNGNGGRDGDEPVGPFPVAAEAVLGKGRLVLISDASILTNSMIRRDDNYRFLEETLGLSERRVIFDMSHISRSPLDQDKEALVKTRKALSDRYVMIALILLALVLTLKPLWRQRMRIK